MIFTVGSIKIVFRKTARRTLMGHMYFVRHGQTVWNVENKICGSTDIDLTEKVMNRLLKRVRKFFQRI